MYQKPSKTPPTIFQKSPPKSSKNHQEIYQTKSQIPKIWSKIRYVFSIQYCRKIDFAQTFIVVNVIVVFVFVFFGRNSAPSSPICMKLGGYCPTSLPDLLNPFRTSKNLRKTRGGISGFWRLASEKTVWGDKGGNFEEKTFRKTKEKPEKPRENNRKNMKTNEKPKKQRKTKKKQQTTKKTPQNKN